MHSAETVIPKLINNGASSPPADDGGCELAEIVARLTDELWRDPELSDREILSRYPEHAAELGELLPTFREIAALPVACEVAEEPDGRRAPARELGDFRLVREIGRGGMGVVYEAEQLSLRRRVALKVLPYAAVVDPRQLLRFRHEVQAAALLQHAHVVPVYAVGCDRGVHYYAMQLIAGQSLAQMLPSLREGGERRKTPPESARQGDSSTMRAGKQPTQPVRSGGRGETEYFRRVAEWIAQAAEGLDYAHRRGVVHRDVKPSNLLIDGDGQLWITDFGLAHLESEAGLTITGDLLGTLRYMSPEQALGRRRIIDHRTDVYSLGATAYELLALRPAFADEDRHRLLQRIARETPPPLRSLDRAIPWELETIVRKAMEKDPGDRYATAQDLADDLRRWIEMRPIQARKPSLQHQVVKWCRRHAGWVAGGLICSLLAVVALSVGASLLAREQSRANRALASAQDSRRLARTAVDDMYAELAAAWLADTLEPTPRQRKFLDKALRIYESLAAADPTDPESRREAAAVFLRIGRIQQKIGKRRQAEGACELAIQVLEDLPAELAALPAVRLEASQAYAELGQLRFDAEQVTRAQQAWDRAERLLNDLTTQFPLVGEYQAVRAANLRQLARLALRKGDQAAAERFARESHRQLRALRSPNADANDYDCEELRSAVLLATVLRQTGRPDEARQLADQTAERCAWLIQLQYDSRDLWQVRAAALAEGGDSLIAAQRFGEALARYETALQAVKGMMRVNKAPSDHMFELFDSSRQWTNQIEPNLCCQYVEIQIRQGRALAMSGRYYAGRQALGTAYHTAGVLQSIHAAARFAVAEINALAQLADFLRQRGNAEAGEVALLAGEKWNRLRHRMPEVVSYVSGLYELSDYVWFSSHFPTATTDSIRAFDRGADESLLDERDLPSLQTALGIAWYRHGAYDDAISRLTASLASREARDPFAGFYLAMAYRQTNQRDLARQWFQRSVAWTTAESADCDLDALQSDATRLLTAPSQADAATGRLRGPGSASSESARPPIDGQTGEPP